MTQRTDPRTIERSELLRRLTDEPPANEDAKEGYALVNVLAPEAFAREHIPNSINIPKGNEDEFERRFDRDKPIIVYCASPDCDASPTVAKRLIALGFREVFDYEGGMSDWKQGGNPVAGKNQYVD
jgi:rhodanese-related sulfurtransferase